MTSLISKHSEVGKSHPENAREFILSMVVDGSAHVDE
jgi:hypothetical protein